MTQSGFQCVLCLLALMVFGLSNGCGKSQEPDYTTAELERFGDSGIGSGRIRYARTCPGAWELTVELMQLQPGEKYRLALNALYPDSRESEILGTLRPEAWPPGDIFLDTEIGLPEGYWDFAVITAEDDGTFAETYALPLPAKADGYFLKFLVKEHYGAGNVLLETKSVNFVIIASPGTWFWAALAIVGGVALLLAALCAIWVMLHRKTKGKNVQAAGQIRMEVESWKDLAIGLEFDTSDGKLLYWVATPPPQRGNLFRKRKAVQLLLKGARWKNLLQIVADSEDGKSARKEDVIICFGYAKADPQHTRTLARENVSVLRTARNQVTGAIADLNRKLRKSCQDSGVQIRNDEPHDPPMSVAAPGAITTKFTVRYLLKDEQNRLTWRFPNLG